MKVALLKTSLIDYPNEISSVIFFQGCNFKCVYCHNKGIVEGYDTQQDLREVIEELKGRKKYIEHIVLTGGEVLLQGDRLVDIMRELKSEGFKLKIDTNGSRPTLLHTLIEEKLVDFIAMDLKGSVDDYFKITNTFGTEEDIRVLKESIDIIETSGLPYEFRTTVFNGLHNKKIIEDMKREYLTTKNDIKTQRGTYVKAYIHGFDSFTEYTKKEYQEEFGGEI